MIPFVSTRSLSCGTDSTGNADVANSIGNGYRDDVNSTVSYGFVGSGGVDSNGSIDNNGVDFFTAIQANIAQDGGLYMPKHYPTLDIDVLYDEKFDQYAALCQYIAKHYHADLCFTLDEYQRAIYPFSPLLRIINNKLSILELFHGPTCSFKDFGAHFLAHTLEYILTSTKHKTVVLTATSGDTGSAVAHAFYNKKNVDVVILYPADRVSRLQELQITTLQKNITAVRIDGSFDDCQRLVKQAFADRHLASKISLTSANSINIGRLVPQSFYYCYAIRQLHKHGVKNIHVCVPSGNLGNLTSALIARQCGIPIDGYIAASNRNKVFPRYLKHNRFVATKSKQTISNAMDVGNPSNFERITAMHDNDYATIATLIRGASISDSRTKKTVQRFYREHGYLLDPHTAVGITALSQLSRGLPDNHHTVVVSTAHPCKFAESLTPLIGHAPAMAAQLKGIYNKSSHHVNASNSYDELKQLLLTNFQ